MLPEEVTKFIGQQGEDTITEVEKGAIRRFATAVGDTNPLYYDEEYARNSRYGSIIAPPGFFGWPVGAPRESTGSAGAVAGIIAALQKNGYTNPAAIIGGVEWEFSQPVKAGDTLAISVMIKNISERGVEDRRMTFVFRETTYTNQDGDVVAKAHSTLILRQLISH